MNAGAQTIEGISLPGLSKNGQDEDIWNPGFLQFYQHVQDTNPTG
jgi:hypothetical protein